MTASDRVRIGVIGTSWWADYFHFPALISHPKAAVVAVCGRNQARAREVADKHGVEHVYSDYQRMITDAGLDAVVVVAPDDLHFPMCMAALNAGLHVLCEKPLAYSVAEAHSLLQSAEAAGVVHQMMFTSRGVPHYRNIKSLLDAGYVGIPFEAYFTWPSGWWPQTDPLAYNWHFDPARSHGILSALGSHILDLARWYFGEIVTVQASLHSVVRRPGPAGEPAESANDSAFLILEFASGAHASLHVGGANLTGPGLQHTGNSIVVHGTNGSLETRELFDPPTAVAEVIGLRRGLDAAEHRTAPDELFGGTDPNDPIATFRTQSIGPRQFVDAILGEPSSAATFVDGYAVQQLMEAALKSSQTGRTVRMHAPDQDAPTAPQLVELP
jgi:predicted dehydrogenase